MHQTAVEIQPQSATVRPSNDVGTFDLIVFNLKLLLATL